MGLGGGQHPGLQAGELLGPARVRRVERLVDHLGAAGDVDGEVRIGGIAADDLDALGNPGRAGPVDHPDALAAAEQGLQGGQADGAGAEDDVPGCVVVHDCSLISWSLRWSVA